MSHHRPAFEGNILVLGLLLLLLQFAVDRSILQETEPIQEKEVFFQLEKGKEHLFTEEGTRYISGNK